MVHSHRQIRHLAESADPKHAKAGSHGHATQKHRASSDRRWLGAFQHIGLDQSDDMMWTILPYRQLPEAPLMTIQQIDRPKLSFVQQESIPCTFNMVRCVSYHDENSNCMRHNLEWDHALSPNLLVDLYQAKIL